MVCTQERRQNGQWDKVGSSAEAADPKYRESKDSVPRRTFSLCANLMQTFRENLYALKCTFNTHCISSLRGCLARQYCKSDKCFVWSSVVGRLVFSKWWTLLFCCQKLGTVLGVYFPCIQNIFGVILFIRMVWVVGAAGWLQSFIIVFTCCCCVCSQSVSLASCLTHLTIPLPMQLNCSSFALMNSDNISRLFHRQILVQLPVTLCRIIDKYEVGIQYTGPRLVSQLVRVLAYTSPKSLNSHIGAGRWYKTHLQPVLEQVRFELVLCAVTYIWYL